MSGGSGTRLTRGTSRRCPVLGRPDAFIGAKYLAGDSGGKPGQPGRAATAQLLRELDDVKARGITKPLPPFGGWWEAGDPFAGAPYERKGCDSVYDSHRSALAIVTRFSEQVSEPCDRRELDRAR